MGVVTSPRLLPRVRASELVGRGWLNTGGRAVTLAELRGSIVLLDFWTFCCINCLHVLDELRDLEREFADALVIVGVHSPKFAHEGDPAALAAAVERYEVRHPVLDDPELVTWSAYTARAWPTLVVIDPEGYIVAQLAGEGHAHNLSILIGDLVREHEAKGTLRRGDGPYVAPAPASGTLRFPAAAIALPGGTFLVADAGHHSLAELAADGETLVRRIGSGERGRVDGGPQAARFSEPNGLCAVPAELRAALGYDVVVADTVNHALRGLRLADGAVTTLAGTGSQYLVGGPDNGDDAADAPPWRPLDARAVRLSSPWDVVWSPAAEAFVIAMAGSHTLWVFDPVAATVRRLAGTMNEGLEDGPLAQAWFAQTSGLAVDAGGRIWLADSEVSALRYVDLEVGGVGTEGVVGTAVGAGLYDFGFRDGAAPQALLQHPLGVAVLPDGSVVVADTYNGAIRRYAPAADGGPAQVTTLARDLAEPSGVVVLSTGAAGGAGGTSAGVELLVVESAAHRLTRIRLPQGLAGEILDAGAHRTQRPVTEVPSGALRLEVVFAPAAGQKYDDRYGPSTHLRVSATPPGLLLAGAGDGVDLVRELRLDPDVAGGVLHVTAKAASCDADPAIEYPACHLNTQDWGVPVRVVTGAEPTLVLPLHG
ncbi:NHL domain-containing thioredoxin family protein [Pengzhenrongella sicca]|uniref:NHL domain-containing thioredoxin family protein n=1 Tax=Pengzhenrongella sicca TaxID=2819238 RepID=A0A8A4ZBY0_9MICO|nr:NHL domain-containing thioredoxin family protein [Pengzhenrongella sicca]QTE29432.1 NHL domain-containing thioredoxin family protein [Pengzhenrongella sicca]